MGISQLRRITDLFEAGQELVLGQDDDGSDVVVWVQKLSTHQRTECQRDGLFASQVRRGVALESDSGPVKASYRMMTAEELVDQAASRDAAKAHRLARDDVQADPEWQERIVLIDRAALMSEEDATPQEWAVITQASKDFTQAMSDALDARFAEIREPFEGMEFDALVDAAFESYVQARQYESFNEAYSVTQVYYSLRECQARLIDGRFDHERCTHKRMCPSREHAQDLPEEIVSLVLEAMAKMEMSEAEVGKSRGPSASSKPSDQPKSPEA